LFYVNAGVETLEKDEVFSHFFIKTILLKLIKKAIHRQIEFNKMKFQLIAKWLTLAVATVAVGDAQECPVDEAPTFGAACCPDGANQGAVCREISYVLLAVSGTLEEGFELRKNMDYRPFGDDGPGRVNATFLGKALVRGYKSFLDIKNPTWR
jgi:hypothetical protein